MTRTVEKRDGSTWLDSDAADVLTKPASQLLPLDKQMGTGFLNAKRAKKQLEGGEQHKGNVSERGWDYGTIERADGDPIEFYRYVLPTLKGGSYISATLAWDRLIDLEKGGGNTQANTFEPGATFGNARLADLNLYLMPFGETNTANALDRKSTRLNSSHIPLSRMPSSA